MSCCGNLYRGGLLLSDLMKICLDCLFTCLCLIKSFVRYCFIRFLDYISSLKFFTIVATNDYYFKKQNDYHRNSKC
jgi:hypothetical protein